MTHQLHRIIHFSLKGRRKRPRRVEENVLPCAGSEEWGARSQGYRAGDGRPIAAGVSFKKNDSRFGVFIKNSCPFMHPDHPQGSSACPSSRLVAAFLGPGSDPRPRWQVWGANGGPWRRSRGRPDAGSSQDATPGKPRVGKRISGASRPRRSWLRVPSSRDGG